MTRLLGLQASVEGLPITDVLPELGWKNILRPDASGGRRLVRQEFEVHYPRPRFLAVYAAPLDGEARGSSGMALILNDATEARQKTFEAIESERIQSLTLLAASVAHEIGNPLNALHIHLQLMEREVQKLGVAGGVAQRARAVFPGAMSKSSRDGGIAANWRIIWGWPRARSPGSDYIVTQFLQAIRPSSPQFTPGSVNEVVRETLELLGPELENRRIECQGEIGAARCRWRR